MNEKVIWTHPKGRFEVVERAYRAMDGSVHRTRDCRFLRMLDGDDLVQQCAMCPLVEILEMEEQHGNH